MTSKYLEDQTAATPEEQEERELKASSRDASRQLIHHAVTDIWGYVRNHAESLDSAKHCDFITTVIDKLVARLADRNADLSAELNRAKKAVLAKDKQLKTVKSNVGDKPAAKVREPKPSNVATYAKQPPLAENETKHKDIL